MTYAEGWSCQRASIRAGPLNTASYCTGGYEPIVTGSILATRVKTYPDAAFQVKPAVLTQSLFNHYGTILNLRSVTLFLVPAAHETKARLIAAD
jgi:hypothetical protein